MKSGEIQGLYRGILTHGKGLLNSEPGLIGAWRDDVAANVKTMAHALLEPDPANPPTVLKKSDRITTVRAPFFNEDAVIKKYDLPSLLLKLKYLARPSRARRAWAAAQTLDALAIPTPAPLAILEVGRGLSAHSSFYVCRYVEGAQSLRTWIRGTYAQLTTESQSAFRNHLAQQVLSLYEHGIYHADLKAANMLIQAQGSTSWTILFIDLDAIQFGVTPSRRQIIRNLVQLNGSLGSKTPDADRLAFLDLFATAYPWLRDDAVISQIRSWTRRRLQRELNRTCGP